jgi:hypothetical protein
MARCENEWRRRGTRCRGSVSRCERNAVTQVWRTEEREGRVVVAVRQVCGHCANRVTTGSQRDGANPWRRRGQ